MLHLCKLVSCQILIAILLLCVSTGSTQEMANEERSFLMIKPDGVQRGLVGEIIKRFEAKVSHKLSRCDY